MGVNIVIGVSKSEINGRKEAQLVKQKRWIVGFTGALL